MRLSCIAHSRSDRDLTQTPPGQLAGAMLFLRRLRSVPSRQPSATSYFVAAGASVAAGGDGGDLWVMLRSICWATPVAGATASAISREEKHCRRIFVRGAPLVVPSSCGQSFRQSPRLPARGYTARAVSDIFIWFLARVLGVGMHQLRQKAIGRWEEVVERVAKCLARYRDNNAEWARTRVRVAL